MPRATASSTKSADKFDRWGDEPMRIDPAIVALERRISTTRPHPPEEVGDDVPERFVPDQRFADWIRGTFIDATGPLANEEHEHLADARIGVLWTNVINNRQMRQVLATAEIPQTMGGAWKRGRAEQQIRDWFEADIDFLLTFYAPGCRVLEDRGFCGLVKHELCHCAQDEDRDGFPKFDRNTGSPLYAIRGHDVEEFVSVTRMFGPTPDVMRLVDAAKARPVFGDSQISIACGTCARMAA